MNYNPMVFINYFVAGAIALSLLLADNPSFNVVVSSAIFGLILLQNAKLHRMEDQIQRLN